MSKINNKLSIKNEVIVLDFNNNTNGALPYQIIATIIHDHDTPVSYSPPNNVAKPTVLLSLLKVEKPEGSWVPLVTPKVVYTTAPADATPYLEILSSGEAYWYTTPGMVLGSLFFHAVLWMNNITQSERKEVMDIVGTITNYLEHQFPNNVLSENYSPTLNNLIDASSLQRGQWYHIAETKLDSGESLWVKRRIVRESQETYRIESRYTFMESGNFALTPVETKTTYTETTGFNTKPQSIDSIVECHNLRKERNERLIVEAHANKE